MSELEKNGMWVFEHSDKDYLPPDITARIHGKWLLRRIVDSDFFNRILVKRLNIITSCCTFAVREQKDIARLMNSS